MYFQRKRRSRVFDLKEKTWENHVNHRPTTASKTWSQQVAWGLWECPRTAEHGILSRLLLRTHLPLLGCGRFLDNHGRHLLLFCVSKGALTDNEWNCSKLVFEGFLGFNIKALKKKTERGRLAWSPDSLRRCVWLEKVRNWARTFKERQMRKRKTC